MDGQIEVGRERARIDAFDGIRGLAVVAVLLFHAQLAGARGGFLGVSAFFTLSGFLITTLLLDEHRRTGSLSLRAFWSRRARRLLPAAFLTVSGVLLFAAMLATGDQLRALRGDVLGALADVANWRFYFAGRDYSALFSAPSPVAHFWSLAIEEQFYLVFPLLMLGVVRVVRGNRALLATVLAAGAAASIVAGNVLVRTTGESRVYYGTDTRAAELLIGALLAVALTGRPMPRPSRTRATVAAVAGTGALALMVFWWATVPQASRWLYEGGFAVHACLTVVVIAAARQAGPFARALAWRPLAAVGLLSYGIYLFHWPIYLWLSPERTGLSTAPLLALRLTVTLALAGASYLLLERPIRYGRRTPRVWPRVAAIGTAAALVAGAFTITWTTPAPEVTLTALGDAPSPIALATPITTRVHPARSIAAHARNAIRPVVMYRKPMTIRPLRVLVVGDSVGITLGRGFELWARASGGTVVDNIALKYCPLGRTLPAQQGMAMNESLGRCDWTQRWAEAVRDFDPDVVVVMFSIWEASPRRLPDGGWQQPGDAAFDRWQLSEYQAAADTLSARGAALVWMNAPCVRDGPVTPGTALYTVDRVTIPKLARSRAGVHPVDLEHAICPHDAFSNSFGSVTDFRPDGGHFSDRGALAVANWAMPFVLGQAPAPRYLAR